MYLGTYMQTGPRLTLKEHQSYEQSSMIENDMARDGLY